MRLLINSFLHTATNFIKFFIKFSNFNKVFISSTAAVLLLINSAAMADQQYHQHSVLQRNQLPIFYTNTWFERLHFSGLIMGEIIASSLDQGEPRRFGSKGSYSTFCFPRAGLYVDADLNDWAIGHSAFNFSPTSCCSAACGFGQKNDEFRFTKFDKVDESYVTFAKFDQSPYYARAGIQYLPFGNYNRHNIPAALPQLLTQTQAAGLTIGRIGTISPSIYVFSSKSRLGGTQKIGNGGFQLSYFAPYNIELSIDWMYNIAAAVNYLVPPALSTTPATDNALSSGYRKSVSSVCLTAKQQLAAWDGTIQYTHALNKFASDDIAWRNTGAKLKAAMLDLGYNFNSFVSLPSRAGASYQWSDQAVNVRGNGNGLGLPQHRLQADYMVNILPNIETGAHLIWDKDYRASVGGTGQKSWTMLLTLIAKFR